MTFRQIHLGLSLQMGAGRATAEGLEPSPDPAAPLRPLPAPSHCMRHRPALWPPHQPRVPTPPGRGGGVRASRRLGRGGVPGSPLPEGDNRGRPQARNFSVRDSGGWGGDVLNFYWLLMLCIFFRQAGGKKSLESAED